MSETDRNPEKPTEEWVTGDEAMTGPQESYLHTLAREAGEDVPAGLTKAEASDMIDRLQQATGRGKDLVEPEGVNAGAASAERDRRPDGDVAASAEQLELPDEPAAAGEELVGATGERADRPGQELAAGEG